MLYGPITEQTLRDHYAGVKRRLGLTSRRLVRQSAVPGVAYEYRGPHNSTRREYMLIERKAAPVELVDDGYLPAWKVILREVAEKHGIEPMHLRKGSRVPARVVARHEACYRIYNETSLSYSQIAAILGYCDHSPVYHAINRHKASMGL